MLDYERLFAKSLREKLKERIVGKIFVQIIDNDVLYVKIESYGGLVYTYRMPGFPDKFLNGFTPEHASDGIVNNFKIFLFKKYMK